MSLFLFFFLFPQSLNGVWLNRERLAPLQGYCIRKGDHIQLGVPLESRETAEYEYEVIEEDWESLAPALIQPTCFVRHGSYDSSQVEQAG